MGLTLLCVIRGGMIGMVFAGRHPERIKRLVAIGANYDVDGLRESPILDSEVPHAPLRYRLFAPDPTHWPALHRKVVKMWQTKPHYTLNDLGHIKAPTLIMAGEFDIIKPEHSAQLAKAIPEGQEIIIRGATHAVPVEKPVVVNCRILRFLDYDNRPE